jgi:hypothetical protein
MKISTLDRCLMDMDMSQNPFLCQLITTSELNPTEIKDLMQLASSVNCQVQLATVIKSGLKSILVTVKNSLVTIPALSMLQFIKPENISPTLTFDEHRSIIVHARGGNHSSVFSKPIFQQPFFLIAKNMLFSMIVKDVTGILQAHGTNKAPPVEQALKKLDDYFDTIPDSPMVSNPFEAMPVPPSAEDDFWASLNETSKQDAIIACGTTPKRPSSCKLVNSPNKRRTSIQSFTSSNSWLSVNEKQTTPEYTTEQLCDFNTELAQIFPHDESIDSGSGDL